MAMMQAERERLRALATGGGASTTNVFYYAAVKSENLTSRLQEFTKQADAPSQLTNEELEVWFAKAKFVVNWVIGNFVVCIVPYLCKEDGEPLYKQHLIEQLQSMAAAEQKGGYFSRSVPDAGVYTISNGEISTHESNWSTQEVTMQALVVDGGPAGHHTVPSGFKLLPEQWDPPVVPKYELKRVDMERGSRNGNDTGGWFQSSSDGSGGGGGDWF